MRTSGLPVSPVELARLSAMVPRLAGLVAFAAGALLRDLVTMTGLYRSPQHRLDRPQASNQVPSGSLWTTFFHR